MHKILPIGLLLALTTPTLAVAQHAPIQKTEFERAMDRAPQDAREAANRTSPQVQREAAANRAGIDHDGRLPVNGTTSIGGTVEQGGATVNVRTDWPH